MSYQTLHVHGGVPVKAWVNGVPFDPKAELQLRQTAQMPFIHKWVAAMPDVHVGIGATIGSVIPTKAAIIPAAVGVDLGCGMMAVQTSLAASDLPDHLAGVRDVIERAIPHGRSGGGRRNDKGAWSKVPKSVDKVWKPLAKRLDLIVEKHPRIKDANDRVHLGTLGTGNHFVEVCLDEQNRVWFMLHSGSRGIGNRIGTMFINLAKKDMERQLGRLPHRDLAYFSEGSAHFDDYVEAVLWAQDFARNNREIMMVHMIEALRDSNLLPPFETHVQAVNCHHNYAAKESHYGEEVWVTRKGAVRAGLGEMGIIPGSMGACSFIVRGKGNPESFHTCSHGAGRVMSRTEAKRSFSIADHAKATAGVECRKDEGVIDETPMAYKPIHKVMEAQADLVEIVHTLKQVVCVKG
ncbi:MAG: RtcB family protein [Acidobacteria bacterium]|nr:RtcB family protein [Acidobacteriota bacterium]